MSRPSLPTRPDVRAALGRLRAVRRLRPAVPGAVRVLVAGGAAAGLVWAATSTPSTLDLAAASGAVPTEAPSTSLATTLAAMCPGNELSGISGADDMRVGGTVTAVTGPDDLLPVPVEGEGEAALTAGSAPLGELPAQRPGSVSADLPRSGPVALDARSALAPATTATQEWRVDEDGMRGLATSPCLPAASDMWLLAGGAGPGRQERLVLVNPGGNPVTADVTVHGEAGRVGEPRSESVPPGGRVTLLVDALAGEESLPVVHVAASGGGLHATLTDTWVDGLAARGAETVVPAADPSRRVVVPAAVLGGRAAVRVAVPGDEEAVARVTLVGRDGVVPTEELTVLSVPGGAVGELPLPDVQDGTYGVVVEADVPVTAAVRTEVGPADGYGEIAWSEAAAPVEEVAGTALPDTSGVERTLRLLSTVGGSTVRVSLVVDGEVETRGVDLGRDRAADVDLDGASAVWVARSAGSGEVRGGVVSTSGTGAEQMLSVVPLEPVAVSSPVSRAFPLP
ncbi:hypothetical protein KC207_11575 [Phycicoccus sp. BSK3Z-2]|uniref:Large extracellular alpha-helical protein n=1 Tax=Phycicoccus avicenniae TaxID=2828860 RepID=A0A941I151_9MICO|nr:DUF5719 family protein [Phycicoccus avicenniae]MBR7743931.1 hypothetical protein [Phycicoccus avicenniae]